MVVELPAKEEVAAQLYPDMPPGFPYENFDVHELILPDGDDMGIKSEDDDINEDSVQTETGFGSFIVVVGLPIVGQEKHEKLFGVIKKLVEQNARVKPDGVFMPKDAEGNTKGCAFVEYYSPADARLVREQIYNRGEGVALDKRHTLFAFMLDDFDTLAKVPDEYAAREAVTFKPADNLFSWMMDKMGRDQFVIRHGTETEVVWNDGKRGRVEPAFQRNNWTESFVQWSPQGTMLATMHRQGVALWGGPTFTRQARVAHPNVRLIDFSPNETYIFTYTSQEPLRPNDRYTVVLQVWDVRTGKVLRVFEGAAEEYAVSPSAASVGASLKWPIFKWAGGREDRYFARLSKAKDGKMAISVYEAPDMTLLDKKSVVMEHLQDFEWSPSDSLLAAYTGEQKNTPARIVLLRIPDRKEIRMKNLFDVHDVRMLWHPQGDYLCVKVERWTKTKKSSYTGFEIFSLRDKDVPMEVFELPNKNEKVLTFAWEPKGHRLAVVHGEGARPNVSFFTMRDDKGRLAVRLLTTLTNRPCNSIHWSPQGKYLVIAGLKALNGQLEFYNVDDGETMATAEHFMATDVDWDPTGRYVATSVTSLQGDSGFQLWSFSGKLLVSQSKDALVQFAWRPRLPSVLPPEKEAEVVKNLKQYAKRYEEEDEALLMQADADVLQERQRMLDEWASYLESKDAYRKMAAEFAAKVYGARWGEKEFTLQKASVEQVLEAKEEQYVAK